MALTRLNFVRRHAPLAGWRLALLLAMLAASVATSVDLIVNLRKADMLEQQWQAAQPRRTAPARLSASQSREQEQQVRIIADAVRQLNLPVGRLMRALQTPRDIHVALLGVDLNGKNDASDAAGGTIKLSAEAASAHDMVNYVAFLGEQSLLTSVYLVKHELAEGSPEHAVRFQVEAQWKE